MRFSIAIFLAVPVRVIIDYARRYTILALVNINKPFPNFQNVAIGYVNTPANTLFWLIGTVPGLSYNSD